MKINFKLFTIIFSLFFLSTASPGQIIKIPYLKNNKWGYADTAGNIIYQPKFDSACFFFKGRAEVFVDGKKGLLDSSLKFFIARPEYESLDWISKNELGEDLMIVQKKQKYGVISKYEELTIPYKYDHVKHIRKKAHFFYCTKDNGVDVYVVKGHAAQKILSKKDSIFEYKSTSKVMEFRSKTTSYRFSEEGQFLGKEKGAFTTKKEIGHNNFYAESPSFDMPMEEKPPKVDNYLIYEGNKVGMISHQRKYNPRKGEYIYYSDTVPSIYDSIQNNKPIKGKLIAKKEGAWGIINTKNEESVPFKFQGIAYHDYGVYVLKVKAKSGAVILYEGRYPQHLLSFDYDKIQLSHKNWNWNLIVEQDGQRYYIFRNNTKRKIPIKEYKVAWITEVGGFKLISLVTKTGKTVYIGENGVYFFQD